MDRAEARAVEAAPTATTKRRTRRGRAAALGVAALIAGAASVPVGMVEIGTRRAAACLAKCTATQAACSKLAKDPAPCTKAFDVCKASCK